MTAEVLDEDLEQATNGPLLASVDVQELFGRYTYRIDVPLQPDGTPSRLILLYGENGSGKTTVLTLLWNLLSPAPNRGHRSVLAKVPFSSLSATFADGTRLTARKKVGLVGSYDITLVQPGRPDLVVQFEADDDLVVRPGLPGLPGLPVNFDDALTYAGEGELSRFLAHAPETARQVIENQQAEDSFIRYLHEAGINPLFLADDRSLYSDDEEVEKAREKRPSGRADVGRREVESANQAVARELRITIGRVNEWLRTLTIRGQSVGSAGANTIYGNVLRQLGTSPPVLGPVPVPAPSGTGSAHDLLMELEKKSPQFEEFELVPHFAADEFSALLEAVPPERQQIAHDILIPYLTSLHARIEALEEAERMLRALLTLLNEFLVDKRFTFSPRHGLRIVTEDGTNLAPASLSSGERQLTMLLCTTLLARRDSRLFIIDEPELSLGVPWQRAILGSLLELTEGTFLQFVVATHSVEMITSQRENLVRLERQVDGSTDR